MIILTPVTDENIASFHSFFPNSLLSLAAEDNSLSYMGIIYKSTAIGGLVLKKTGPSMELLWILLSEDYRGMGLGARVMNELFINLYREGITDVFVTTAPETPDSMRRLLSGFPFSYSEVATSTLVTTLGDLRANKHLAGGSKKCQSLEKSTQTFLAGLYKNITEHESDLIPVPIDKHSCNSDASAVYVEDGEAKGILILQPQSDCRYRIPFMYSCSSNPLAPIEMIRFSVAAGTSFPDDTELVFDLVSAELTKFAEKLFGGTPEHAQVGQLKLSYLDEVFAFAENTLV